MQDKWKIAGYLFVVATVALTLSLISNLYTYYLKDMESGETTVSESCNENEDDLVGTMWCHSIKQEKMNSFAGALIAAGLAFVCFAKSDELEKHHGRRNVEQQTQQTTHSKL